MHGVNRVASRLSATYKLRVPVFCQKDSPCYATTSIRCSVDRPSGYKSQCGASDWGRQLCLAQSFTRLTLDALECHAALSMLAALAALGGRELPRPRLQGGFSVRQRLARSRSGKGCLAADEQLRRDIRLCAARGKVGVLVADNVKVFVVPDGQVDAALVDAGLLHLSESADAGKACCGGTQEEDGVRTILSGVARDLEQFSDKVFDGAGCGSSAKLGGRDWDHASSPRKKAASRRILVLGCPRLSCFNK